MGMQRLADEDDSVLRAFAKAWMPEGSTDTDFEIMCREVELEKLKKQREKEREQEERRRKKYGNTTLRV